MYIAQYASPVLVIGFRQLLPALLLAMPVLPLMTV